MNDLTASENSKLLIKENHNDKSLTALQKDAIGLAELGKKYIAIAQYQKAEETFLKAHEFDPLNPDINYNLGFFAELKADYDQAITFYEATIKADPTIKESYIQLGNVLNIRGQKKEALLVFREAERHLPEDTDIQFCRGKMAAEIIPGWHLPMLADQERNDAFQNAIEKLVKPGDIVLDIGTGSGLLAMMAARAGAEHVYACEVNETIAVVAQEIINLNGYADKITVITKDSNELKIGIDIPEKVDGVVSETFDFALVGEGALRSLRYAKDHLLKEDGYLIPQSAELTAVVLECPFLSNLHQMSEINGFDLSPINIFSSPMTYKDVRITLGTVGEYRVLSEPFSVAKYDFHALLPGKSSQGSKVTAIENGIGDSIHMWLDLYLCDGITLSTKVCNSRHHWRQPTQSLLTKLQMKTGESFIMCCEYEAYFNFKIMP